MPLYGTLDAMPLSELLRWLAASSQTGTLQIERDRVRRWIILRSGKIIACASDDPPERLGHFLLARGLITEDQLRIALSSQADNTKPLGRILIEMGALGEPEMDAVLDAKAEETLVAIFDMAGAVFRFQEGATERQGAFPIQRDVEEIVERGRQRHEEVERIRSVFHDPKMVLTRSRNRPPDAILANPTARTIYEAIDGVRSVEELLLHIHGSEYLVTKFLYELHRAGFVQVPEEQRPSVSVPESTTPVADRSTPEPPTAAQAGPIPVASHPTAVPDTEVPTHVAAAVEEVCPDESAEDPLSALDDATSKPDVLFDLDADPAEPSVEPAIEATDADTDADPGDRLDPAVLETLDLPDEFQQTSDVEALEESVAFKVERRLETARVLLNEGEFEPALTALDELYREFPDDDSLRRLIAEAEAAFRDKAYRHYLPAEKIPVLTVPIDKIEAQNLSPSEFFLLSRIDGTWNLKSIIQIAPIREIEALLILKRMRESGLIEFRDPASA